jgi:hypothetical protein
MADDLRRCWGSGCCCFVNNQPVTREEYEKAVQSNQRGLNLPGPVETLIPCRKSGDKVQEATEIAVGFYLGSGITRAFGTIIPHGNGHSVFDRATGNFLREATNEDIQKWNEARSKAIEAAQR